MSGSDIAYHRGLCARYAISGTDSAHRGTRADAGGREAGRRGQSRRVGGRVLPSVLHTRYAMSCTHVGQGWSQGLT
eukprot:3936455-Rhodomonas_salina.2